MTTHKQHIRVANIIEEGRWGGPQHRITSVAKRLKNRGIETLVIMPQRDNSIFAEKLQVAGISFRAVKLHKLTRNKQGLVSFLIHFPTDIWRIRNIIKQSEVQLVHCNSAGQWKGLIAAKLAGCPTYWHLNDTNMPKSVRLVFKLLAKWVVTSFLLSAERVSSYYLQDKFSNYPRFILRPPVDCEFFRPENNFNITQEDTIKVIGVGNINADKDTKTYVRAAQLLRDEFGSRIHCAQVGPEFESQKHYIASVKELNNQNGKQTLEFLGGQQDIRPFLKQSDIFICSSRAESGPMSVFEAMAMGLPIVTTDVGDLAIMNSEGDFARVVPVGDHVALARAASELVKSPEERKHLGRNARRYALKNLNVEICAIKHAKAYCSLLDLRQDFKK